MANKAEWEKFSNLFKKLTVAAHTKLLVEGEFLEQAFIIQKGCIWSFTEDDKQDITYQFFLKMKSFFCRQFLNNNPS